MEIIRAEHMGFCYGVKRAMKLALEAETQDERVGVLGELIHNRQALQYLKEHGISTLKNIDEVFKTRTNKIIFRSHGESPQSYEIMQKNNIEIVDATCPDVLKVQKTARKMAEDNLPVIIVGEKQHPEVKSILAWAGENAFIVENKEDAEKLTFSPELGIVAQTTFIGEKLQEILTILQSKCIKAVIELTTCNATQIRQDSAKKLSEKVDIMIVVGGKDSANTQHLWEICTEHCGLAYHIETKEDLVKQWFDNTQKIGITAGASTPEWVIEEVIMEIEKFVEEEKEITMGELLKAVEQEQKDEKEKAWEIIADSLKNKKEITVEVSGEVKGGLLVNIQGVRGFMPASQVDIYYVDKLNHFLGQKLIAKVIEFDQLKQKIILSRKIVLQERKEKQEKELIESLIVGQTVKGRVKRFTDFGVFIDLGGIDGLLHNKDISWEKEVNPKNILKSEAEYQFLIIKIDKKNKKIALSLKELQSDPWFSYVDDLKEGMIIEGQVLKLVKFGAFIGIKENKIEGLVPLREICEERIIHSEEKLNLGEKVNVKILSIDKENKKLGFSIVQAFKDKERNEFAKYLEHQGQKSILSESIGDKFGDLFENFKK